MGGIWPVGRYACLVDAALGIGDPLAAWHGYLDGLGGERPNDGERRLYPFVLQSLGPRIAEARDAEHLARARRACIMSTLANLRTAASTSALLAERGIPHVYSKGMALAARVYRRPDLRQSADIDIHVPERHGPAMFALAREAGWEVKGIWREPRPAMYAVGSTTFVTRAGEEIDVHWRPRREFSWDREMSDHFFATAHDVEWHGSTWTVASDTWLLIETIVHGLAYNPVVPLRWVIDAYFLLAAGDVAIDYDLLRRASARSFTRPAMREAFTVLADLGADIGAAGGPLAAGGQAGLLERMAFALKLKPAEGIGSVPGEAIHFLLRAPGSRIARLCALPGYLRSDIYEYRGWRSVARRLLQGARSSEPVLTR